MSDSSFSLASTTERLSEVSEQINQIMHKQHNGVIGTEAASEKVIIAIKEVTENTNECAIVLDKNITSINELNTRILESVEQISELKSTRNNIGEIVSQFPMKIATLIK